MFFANSEAETNNSIVPMFLYRQKGYLWYKIDSKKIGNGKANVTFRFKNEEITSSLPYLI
jgi:hypothetical protein